MPSKKESERNMHHPAPESGTPEPSKEQVKETSSSLPESQKVKPEQKGKEGTQASRADTAPSASADDSEANSDAASDGYWTPKSEKTPEPASAPCTCRCGGCCCHGKSSEESQHCVRCHADYTFNHSQACMVPHVFSFDDLDGDEYPRDLVVRSICCGSNVTGGVPIDREWDQPKPCFMGWHTTDADGVKEEYNGFNVLRCDLNPRGKCLRIRMKHPVHYKHLYDSGIKYKKTDCEDRGRHLKRKKVEEDKAFEHVFGHVDEEQVMSAKKRRIERGY